MLGPFNLAALSAGLLTNFTYDIIKNKATASQRQRIPNNNLLHSRYCNERSIHHDRTIATIG